MYSDGNSFEEILQRALNNDALINVDKREGSIIYDTLAPVCMELAEAYLKMDIMENQSSLLTATGENLDKKAFDYGVKRYAASKASRIAIFKKYKVDENGDYILDADGNRILVDMDIPEDSRFIVPQSVENQVSFIYIGKREDKQILECEYYGTQGNVYLGNIIPITPIGGLIEAKIIDTYIPGEDEETDLQLRDRLIETINSVAFGGNIDDYIQYINSIEGVGNTKVFPAWQYNGSVLLSVVDGSFNPIGEPFKNLIKEQIDPEDNSGEGLGIAPIGHYVTVTTPKRDNIKISITISLVSGVLVGEITESIEKEIEDYFLSVRQKFGQDSVLGIYRARIVNAVLNVPEVLNVTNVMLNDLDEDIVFEDVPLIDGQHLPYIEQVVINE